MSHTRDKTPSEPVLWQKAKSNCACERYQMCLWFINLSGDCLWYLKSNSCFIHQLLPTSTRVFSWEPQQCRQSICLFNHVWVFITHDMFNLDSESRVIIIMMKPGQCWVINVGLEVWARPWPGGSSPDIPIGVLQDSRTCSELRTRVWVGRES